jgi:hypothetical protein
MTMSEDDEQPPSPEELAQAAQLAGALERNDTAELIRAAAGHAMPLGDVRARALAREAVRGRARPRRRMVSALLSLAAVALLLLFFALRPTSPPDRLQSHSAGLLVPGPFPADQTAAQRLDLVSADRMIALREARLYAARGGQ